MASTSRRAAFKLFGKHSPKRDRDHDRPPTPPAKDPDKIIPYARYNVSSPSLLNNNSHSVQTPSSDSTKDDYLSPSTASSSRSNLRSPSSAKFLSKFASLGRRPRPRNGSMVNGSERSISAGTSGGSSNELHEFGTLNEEFEMIDSSSFDDGSISTPWNFQHNVHVNEKFEGLPPSWAIALAERGYTQEEIESFERQRRQSLARTSYAPVQDDDITVTFQPRIDSLRMGSPLRPGSPFSTSNSITHSSRSQQTHSGNNSFTGSVARTRQRAPTPLRVVNPEGLHIDIDSDEECPRQLSAIDETISPPPAYRPPTSNCAGAINLNSTETDRPWPNDTKYPVPGGSTPPAPTRAPPPPPISEGSSDVLSDQLQSPTTDIIQSPTTEATTAEEPSTQHVQSSEPIAAAIIESESVNVPASEQSLKQEITQEEEPETREEQEVTSQQKEPETRDQPPPLPEKLTITPNMAPVLGGVNPATHMRTRSSTFGNAITRLQVTKQQQQRPPPLPLPPNMNQQSTRSSAPSLATAPKPLTNIALLKSHFSPITPSPNPELELISKSGVSSNRTSTEPGEAKRNEEWRKHIYKFSESSVMSSSSIVHPYSATYEEDLKDPPTQQEEEGEGGEEEEEEPGELRSPLSIAPRRISFNPLRLSLGPISGSDDSGGGWARGLLDVLGGFSFDGNANQSAPQIKESSPSSNSRLVEPEASKEKEQKRRSRPSELTLNLLPSPPQEAVDQPKLSSQSKLSTACSLASEDPSPLWNEIMNMVNPSSDRPSKSPAVPLPSQKIPVVESSRTAIISQTQMTKPTNGHPNPPQFLNVVDRGRRFSSLRTPPPFPPPMYPPPSPFATTDKFQGLKPPRKLLIPARSDSAPPQSATPSLILPDVSSPSRSDLDSRDESFEGDFSRDSAQLASIRIAEVVRVTESRARTLLPPHSPLAPSSPRPILGQSSLRVQTPVSITSLKIASALPLPVSPAISNNGEASSRSPLAPPGSLAPEWPLPSTVPRTSAEDEPSAIWSYLLEGEADDGDEDAVLESTLVEGSGSYIPNGNQPAPARSSSPTALDQWLTGVRDDRSDGGQAVATYRGRQSTDVPEDSPIDPSLKDVPSPTPQRCSTQKSKRSVKSNKSNKDLPPPPPTQSLRQALDTTGPPAVLQPLAPFIRANADPRQLFSDMKPIAEGQYGNVYAARFSYPDGVPTAPEQVVAVKCVLMEHTEKLESLASEMKLMSNVIHPNILVMEDLYLDLTEDSLWIQMELMERSVADILALYDVVQVEEATVARFTKDALLAVEFLRQCGIAHRDVRSDNMLLSTTGVLKLGDFAHAISANGGESISDELVGIPYWQAPEIRKGPYDFLKVDVWGIGATVWELLEGTPPFLETSLADKWHPLSNEDQFSLSVHKFLDLCSRPAHSRPEARGLLKTDFVSTACPHSEVVKLLVNCRRIEGQATNSS